MDSFAAGLFQGDKLVDIISCLFTVAALFFSLYLWLLDHVSDDEAEFISKKAELLTELNKHRERLKALSKTLQPGSDNAKEFLEILKDVSSRMEVVLSYRFWVRSKQREEYEKICEFHRDSRYLISALNRSDESGSIPAEAESLVGIALDEKQMEDIREDYYEGLMYIIEFIENWE